MAASPMTIEVLPAAFGDCLLVTCPVGKHVWRLLIDTGPDETYPVLRKRLLDLPVAPDGFRHIDLFVVTHIDHDHIGGAKLLIEDRALALRFGDIWFNAPPQRRVRGVAEGQSLAKQLGTGPTILPWNEAWSGAPVCTPARGGGVQLGAKNLPRLTLLSPTPKELKDLYKVWSKELDRLQLKQRDLPEPTPPTTRGRAAALEDLAKRKTPEDQSVPNGSAIAFLLEHQGASALFCADAFPSVLVEAIQSLSKRRGLSEPMPVDLVKLSHHGSRANTTQTLLDVVQAKHYVVSTNNSYFKHPDEEALARVIVSSQAPTLWFNHDTPQNRHWDSNALKKRYGYRANYPTEAGRGVIISL